MPTALQVALAVAGPVAQAASWALVRWRRVSIVWASGITMTVLGVLALLTGSLHASRRFDGFTAIWVGAVAGVVLYGATVAFMAFARRIPAVGRQTVSLYQEASDRSPAVAVGAAALLSAGGEELLWRGVVIGVLGASFGSVAAASLVTWVAYVAVSAVSGRIPIILGAAVGGAVWTGLAWWTGGVFASLECHVLWTALMVGSPPAGARA